MDEIKDEGLGPIDGEIEGDEILDDEEDDSDDDDDDLMDDDES